MPDYSELSTVARVAVVDCVELLKGLSLNPYDTVFSDELPKEMKAPADRILEEVIFKALRPTRIGILSEEYGEDEYLDKSELHWIVDPLDGTVNYVRGIGSCAVSIALWKGKEPIFGVVGEYPNGIIWWGGKEFGAFSDKTRLNVSQVKNVSQAVLCTGFPSRFDFSRKSMTRVLETFSNFGKVRMLGAASLSIIQVAKGSAEVYTERNIMIWDVAAALAILQEAGGKFKESPGRFQNSYNIFASNGLID